MAEKGKIIQVILLFLIDFKMCFFLNKLHINIFSTSHFPNASTVYHLYAAEKGLLLLNSTYSLKSLC